MTPAKARAIDGIMHLLKTGSLMPRQQETTFEQQARTCQQCGREFTGSFKRTVCSPACRDARDKDQAHIAGRNRLRKKREAKA